MRYSLYVDRIFFLHFGMNFLLLWLTACIGDLRPDKRRLAASAAAGSVYFLAVLLFLPGKPGFIPIFKTGILALGAAAMLRLAFGQKRGRELGRTAVLYLAAACALGGAVGTAHGIRTVVLSADAGGGLGTDGGSGTGDGEAAYGGLSAYGGETAYGNPGVRQAATPLSILLPSAAAAALGAGILCRERRRNRNPLWEVRIEDGGKEIQLTGLMDSGNSLYDPISGCPVCVLERAAAERFGLLDRADRFRLIPYHSVGKVHGLLPAAPVDTLYLFRDGQSLQRDHVMLAVGDGHLSAKNRYQMLLHPALLEEKKGENHDIESSDAGKDAV